MNRSTQPGFTIIEVVLFLAVSSLLAIGILAGTGAAIASQRYKDAVATFQSDVQQQFEDTLAVQNDRTDSYDGCEGAAGQSDCILMGKLMTVTEGTSREYRIYGIEPSHATVGDDFTRMRDYQPRASTIDARETELEWGTTLAENVSVLVVRSPDTGAVYAFSRSGVVNAEEVEGMIAAEYRNQDRIMCIEPQGLVVGEKMAVVLRARAAAVSAVELWSNQMLGDRLGGSAQC